MNQEFATPVIQQPDTPKKLKKNFCFATIPFLLIAVLSLYGSIHRIVLTAGNIMRGMDILSLDTLGDVFYFCLYFLNFISAILLSVLLFAKVRNFLISIPLVGFFAGFLAYLCALIAWSIEYDDFGYHLRWILAALAAAVGFLIVGIYTIIITAMKKPAPKWLWIIPAVLFCLFYAPYAILFLLDFVEGILYFYTGFILWIPLYLVDPLYPVAIILFLIWLSCSYKKNKSDEINQPSPEAEPVMPIEEETAETVEADEPAPQPEAEVQPSAESVAEEIDPERTLDYSYREVFYPPINTPEVKPEPEPEIVEKPSEEIGLEQLKNSSALLKEYKKLLDDGIITQEEFDKKKNKLLNL